MDIWRLILGVAVLFAGRRLFWLFVGAGGFVAGMNLAPELLHHRPDWTIFAIALVLGVLGALLALAFQGVAIALAGFLSGSYILWFLLIRTGWDTQPWAWVALLIAGVVGAVLMFVVFDLALVGLSSLMGASLLVESLHLRGTTSFVLVVVCFVLGCVFQGSSLIRERR